MKNIKDRKKTKKLIALSFIISFSFLFFISFAYSSSIWIVRPKVETLEPTIVGKDFVVMRGEATDVGYPSGYMKAYFEYQILEGDFAYYSTEISYEEIDYPKEYSFHLISLQEDTEYRYRARYIGDSILYYGDWVYFQTEDIEPLGEETVIDYSESIMIDGDYFTKSPNNQIAYISISNIGNDEILLYDVNNAPNLSQYISVDNRPVLQDASLSPDGEYLAYYREDTMDILVKHMSDIGTPYYSYNINVYEFWNEIIQIKWTGNGDGLIIHGYIESEDVENIWVLLKSYDFEAGYELEWEDNFFYGFATNERYVSYWDYNRKEIKVAFGSDVFTSFPTSSNTLHRDRISFSREINDKGWFGYVENIDNSEVLQLRYINGSFGHAVHTTHNLTDLTGVYANQYRVRHLKFSYDREYLTFAQGNTLYFFDLNTSEIFFDDIEVAGSQYIIDYEVDNLNKNVYVAGWGGVWDYDVYRFELGTEVVGFEEPVLYTLPVDNVLSESARFNGQVITLAEVDEINLYFEYEEIGGVGFSTLPQTVTTGGTYSVNKAFLKSNQQYRVRVVAFYYLNDTLTYSYGDWVFFTTLAEEALVTDVDNRIGDIVDYVYSLFPEPNDLTSRQKILFVIISMVFVSVTILLIAGSQTGISSFVLYLIAIINLIMFFAFMFIGYISYLVLIVPLLMLIGIVLIKFIKK